MTTNKNEVATVVNNNVNVALTKEQLLKGLGLTIQDIKNTYAKGATDGEFAVFLDACAANNLDPRKKEIYFVKYGASAGNVIVGYPTYISRAERSGLLDGWSAELLRNNADAIIAARVTIHRKDWATPFTWTVERSEFDSNQSIWKKSPGFMLKKVCIAQAFRLCFPNELASMPYTSDELSTFTNVEPTDVAPPSVPDPVAAAKPVTEVPAAPAAPVAPKAAAAAPAAAKPKAPSLTAPAPKKAAPVAAAPVAAPAEPETVEADEVLPPEVPEAPAATAAPVAEPVAEEVQPPSDALAPDVKAKIMSAYATLGISEKELVQAAGEHRLWGEADRASLLASYKEIKAGKLTKDAFLATKSEDF